MSFGTRARQRLKELGDWLFPAALFEPGWGLLRPRMIELSSLPVGEDDRGKIAAAARGGSRVRAVFPVSAFLRRTQSLPRAAMSKAEGAIAVEMRQAFPSQASGLVWRPVFEGIHDGKAEYAIYIARKDQIDALRRVVEAAGGTLAGIGVSGIGPLIDYTDDRRLRHRWIIGSIMVALAMMAAAVAVTAYRANVAEKGADAIAAEFARLQDEAVQLRADLDQQSLLQGGQQSDLVLFETGRGRAQLLLALSAALPDTVWISELTVNGNELMLSGFSTAEMSDVLKSLQTAEILIAPQLAGPALIDGLSGETRFQIRAGVKPGAPE